jgi:hypothetical protein
MNQANAEKLAALPLKCLGQEFPFKSGHVLSRESDLDLPRQHHPAFYGCFDWHSSVHGHWVLVHLLRTFPEMENSTQVRSLLLNHLSEENIQTEIAYFSLNRYTQSFERTYGWVWLLKLADALRNWEDDEMRPLYGHVQPLADLITHKYLEYLPKLNHPIRVGEHSNTAFGLTFAWDYAKNTGNDSLQLLIAERARDYYLDDTDCPISWEPSGYDFLSPCLEEADLMRRVLSKDAFRDWFATFLPGLASGKIDDLVPTQVTDRSDGKLVHLDGLNFSRAWCLYGISKDYPGWNHLRALADKHLAHSLPQIIDGDYAGEHWLGTFALYALIERGQAKEN